MKDATVAGLGLAERSKMGASALRRILAVVLVSVAAAASCKSGWGNTLTDACNHFYSHLNGGGACASCAGTAPSMCNRPGIDAVCESMAGCAAQWCDGAQCQCDGLAKCMTDSGPTCEKALHDYYDCSNAG